jgi:hypothetical protein
MNATDPKTESNKFVTFVPGRSGPQMETRRQLSRGRLRLASTDFATGSRHDEPPHPSYASTPTTLVSFNGTDAQGPSLGWDFGGDGARGGDACLPPACDLAARKPTAGMSRVDP